jgi:DNA-binding transcriptional ArsR family regulator
MTARDDRPGGGTPGRAGHHSFRDRRCVFSVDKLASVRGSLPLVDTYLQAGLEALGDATRMAIFQKLADGPIAVNELARTLPVSRPAVSQHLRVLKDAGLVTDNKAGTRRLYQLNPAGVARLRAHFDQMWTQAMNAFQGTAEKEPLGERHGKHSGRSRRT